MAKGTLTIKNLENAFEGAKKNKHKYVAVKIATEGSPQPEIIINHSDNFDIKLDYYKKAYSTDLVLNTFEGIKITGIASGNDFAWLESSLI